MTKEQMYIAQLQALGVYDPAFEPEIKQLAQMERELTRVKKAWSATAPRGQAPSVLDKHYPIIQQLRRDILTHREALGLTPRALRRLRPSVSELDTAPDSSRTASPAFSAVLDQLKKTAGGIHED